MGSGLFKVIAEFKNESGQPLLGDDYTVTLLDEDRFFDDKLGEAGLNAEGAAEFLVSAVDILSFDSIDERTPDIYFVLRKDGKEVFRSDVFREVDFEVKDPVTGRSKQGTQTFGPFTVPAN